MNQNVLSFLQTIELLKCSKHHLQVTHVCINFANCDLFFLCDSCMCPSHSCEQVFVKTLPGIKKYLLQEVENDGGKRCKEKLRKLVGIMRRKNSLRNQNASKNCQKTKEEKKQKVIGQKEQKDQRAKSKAKENESRLFMFWNWCGVHKRENASSSLVQTPRKPINIHDFSPKPDNAKPESRGDSVTITIPSLNEASERSKPSKSLDLSKIPSSVSIRSDGPRENDDSNKSQEKDDLRGGIKSAPVIKKRSESVFSFISSSLFSEQRELLSLSISILGM